MPHRGHDEIAAMVEGFVAAVYAPRTRDARPEAHGGDRRAEDPANTARSPDNRTNSKNGQRDSQHRDGKGNRGDKRLGATN